MVNSGSCGSYGSSGDRNVEAGFIQLNTKSDCSKSPSPITASGAGQCKNDFTPTADSDLPPSVVRAIEPTPTKTEYMEKYNNGNNETPDEDEESASSLYCSVPLDKVRVVLSTIDGVKTTPTPPSATTPPPPPPRKILCLYCERTFVSVNLRVKHVERCHSNKQNRRVSSRRQAQISTACGYCDKLTTTTEHTLQQLFEHLVEYHSNKYFGCLPCEDRFLNSTHLADHNASYHPPPEPRTESPKLKKVKKDELKKKLKTKRLAVKSSKIALKRSKRLQEKLETPKKRKTKNSEKNKDKIEPITNLTKLNEKQTKTAVNPYPEFDHLFRVKKITDHSIDNLKISSLTFDDVFDKAFFNRIKCNIQENLLHHIDGKLFKNEESESRISNFEKISNNQEVQNSNSENYGCELSLNAVTPTPSLPSLQFGEDLESQIEYGSKPSKKKTQIRQDEVHYKYFTRRKYQASILEHKENRDLSKLDMWTQYIVKNRQQQMLDKQKTPKEMADYTSGEEYKNKIRREELNRILDRRGPFEDLKEEATKMAALDKLNSGNKESISEQSFNDVREVLMEILDRVIREETPPPPAPQSPLQVKEKEPEVPTLTYLNLGRSSSVVSDCEIDKSDKIALICSSQEAEYLELSTNSVRNKNEKIELTGEWARSRIYVCAACGVKLQNIKQLLEHKSVYHQNVWVQHYEFVGNQSELYGHLSIPGLGKVDVLEANQQSKYWRRSEARLCTKCGKQCNSLGELHRHILECGGDWTWMLARKKCKYRPFGAKSRRRRRGLIKRICNQKTPDQSREQSSEQSEKKIYKKSFDGPRPKPSDAETIQRMLANLPAKRATRKIMCLKDGFPKNRNNPKTTTQNKLKCGKIIRRQLTQITPNENSNKKTKKINNRRSLRSINKVLASRILDTNSALIVKRKFKNSRLTQRKQNEEQEKTTTKQQQQQQQQKRSSPRLDKKSDLIQPAEKFSKMSIKRFFPTIKKQQPQQQQNKDDDKLIRNKRKLLEQDADEPLVKMKKTKKEINNFVKLNRKKLKTDVINNKQDEKKLTTKRKLRNGIRKIVNKIKKPLEIDCIKNVNKEEIVVAEELEKDFLEEIKAKSPAPELEKIVIALTPEKTDNADTPLPVPIVVNYSLLNDPIPGGAIFDLQTNNEKILQAKGELNFDNFDNTEMEIKPIESSLNSLTVDTSMKTKNQPLLSPNKGKIRKTARGLNDCIAMLTSKLNTNVQNATIDSIFNLIPPKIVDDDKTEIEKAPCILKVPSFKINLHEENKSEINHSIEKIIQQVEEKEDSCLEPPISEKMIELNTIDQIIEDVVLGKVLINKNDNEERKIGSIRKKRGRKPKPKLDEAFLDDSIKAPDLELKTKKVGQKRNEILNSFLEDGENIDLLELSKQAAMSVETTSQDKTNEELFDVIIEEKKYLETDLDDIFAFREMPSEAMENAQLRYEDEPITMENKEVNDFNEEIIENVPKKRGRKPKNKDIENYNSLNELTAMTENLEEEFHAEKKKRGRKPKIADPKILEEQSYVPAEISPLVENGEKVEDFKPKKKRGRKPKNIESSNSSEDNSQSDKPKKRGRRKILKTDVVVFVSKQTIEENADMTTDDLLNKMDNFVNTEITKKKRGRKPKPKITTEQSEDQNTNKRSKVLKSPVLHFEEPPKESSILRIDYLKKTNNNEKIKEETLKIEVSVMKPIEEILPEPSPELKEQPEVAENSEEEIKLRTVEDELFEKIDEFITEQIEDQTEQKNHESDDLNWSILPLTETIIPEENEEMNTKMIIKKKKTLTLETTESNSITPILENLEPPQSPKDIKENVEITNARRKRQAKSKALEHILDDALLELTESERNREVIRTKKSKKIEENSTQPVEDIYRFEDSNDDLLVPIKLVNKKPQEEQNNNEEVEENENQDQELRRSRRSSRKVASYNENEFVDPLLDDVIINGRKISEENLDILDKLDLIEPELLSDVEDEFKPTTTKRNSNNKGRKFSADKRKLLKENKKKINSDELFDMLKATSNENVVVETKIEVFEHNIQDNFGDLDGDLLDMVDIKNDRDNDNENNEDEEKSNNNNLSEDIIENSNSSKKSNREKKKLSLSTDDAYCDICNKSFCRVESLIKHKRTLTHISKLSEIEAKEAELKKLEIKNDDENYLELEPPFEVINMNESLKLADIINDVLNKPVLRETKHNFSDIIMQNCNEIQTTTTTTTFKSLGERKSFEAEPSSPKTLKSESPKSNNDFFTPQISKTAGTILEKQITLLQNMIENRITTYIDDITISSTQSEDIPRDDNEKINYPLVDDNNKLKVDDNFLRPAQYEEISDDSTNLRNYEEQKSRKVLNRDEELFLECCSLLKSGSEVSNYSKKSNQILNSIELKVSEEPDWLENKSLSQTTKDGFSDNSRIPTPLGDHFQDDESNSNHNWDVFDDLSRTDKEDEDKEKSFTFEEIFQHQDQEEDEEKKKTTKFGEISGVIRNKFNSFTMKLKRKRSVSSTGSSNSAFDNRKPPEIIIPDKKLVTKGAKKVFEGLKVSIPTNDINLSEVFKKDNKKVKISKNRFIFKDNKDNRKKLPMRKKKILNTNDNDKMLDIYDFEETQDNSDIFTKPDFKAFRNKVTDHRNKDDSDNDNDNDSRDLNASDSDLSTKRSKVEQNNITKKKCMIMGRIFKNAAAKSRVDEDIRDIPAIDCEKMVEDFVLSCPDPNLTSNTNITTSNINSNISSNINSSTNRPTKMTQQELDLVFDSLLNDEVKKNAKIVKKLRSKSRKRIRTTSESTDDEEFSIDKSRKRINKKSTKLQDNSINLEQELKECIGVASRKSQRKCTSGKQNVLVEYWSSDESAFENLLETKEIIKDQPLEEKVECFENMDLKVKKLKKEKEKMGPPDFPVTQQQQQQQQQNRRKRMAANPLYHWSSSSEDESPHDLIEVKPIRDELDDDEDRPVQHGWIVGDSPKKLVTMLAQAKGSKKIDVDGVKEQGKKRTIS